MKRLLLIVFLTSIFAFLLNGEIDDDCGSKLETLFAEGKFLVLKIDGVPTMVNKTAKNMARSYCEIVIESNGEWRKKKQVFDESKSSNVLKKGDILKITESGLNRNDFRIQTETDQAMTYDLRGVVIFTGDGGAGTGLHANKFIFQFDSDWDCKMIQAAIKEYFDVYDTKDAITQTKEIKMDMTIAEVVGVLGEPLKKADLGAGKLIYKYEDTIVTFQDGKVVNVEFK